MGGCDLGAINVGARSAATEKLILEARGNSEHPWMHVGSTLGVQVWHVKGNRPVVWPPKNYGIFLSGECFIVLNTTKNADGALRYEVFIWAGLDSSDSDYCAAFHLGVEMDDFVESPVHHREVMGRESHKFQRLFLAMMVFKGGPDDLFDLRQPKGYKPRLLRVQMPENEHGKRTSVVREVPLAASSLNSAETFIYDGGLTLLIWHGKNVMSRKKVAAQNVSQVLFDQRSGRTHREYINQDIDNEDAWFKKIGDRGVVADSPDSIAPIPVGVKRLMKVSDANGDMKMEEVAMADNLSVKQLDPMDAFIVDDGLHVMVWIGGQASVNERRFALNFGVSYLVKYNRPLETPLSRFLEGAETKEFLSAFPDSQPGGLFKQQGLGHRQSKAYRTLKRDPSLSKLIAKSQRRPTAEDLFAHLDRSVPRPEAEVASSDQSAEAPSDPPAVPEPTAVPTLAAVEEAVVAPAEEAASKSTTSPAAVVESQPPAAIEPGKTESVPLDPVATPAAPTEPAAAEPVAVATEAENTYDTFAPSSTAGGGTGTSDGGCPYFHGDITKQQADALLSVDLTKSGRFLLRTYGAAPDQFVLGVVYKNKASHHHVARDAGGLFSVNKQATGASSLNAVIEHLRQSYPWWPVPLTEGIPK